MHLSYITQYTILNRNGHISVLNCALWDMFRCVVGFVKLIYWSKVSRPCDKWLRRTTHVEMALVGCFLNALLYSGSIFSSRWLCLVSSWWSESLFLWFYIISSLERCLRDIIIKLCCYVIQSTRSLEGSQRPSGWRQVSPGRWLPEGDLEDRIA